MQDARSRGRSFARHGGPPQRGPCLRSETVASAAIVAAAVCTLVACGGGGDDSAADQAALEAQGRQIFRYDTFGDEAQWTDTLRLHEVIAAAVDPTTAFNLSSATVVAGLVREMLPFWMPATTAAGNASASTFRPTASAVVGSTALRTASCRRSVSVHFASSPKVS